ncbi:MAG: hypothetical protein IT165_23400 [Bryobacterales bacterium]|nr:hypothetical protein [Bryobacterales bacterium]
MRATLFANAVWIAVVGLTIEIPSAAVAEDRRTVLSGVYLEAELGSPPGTVVPGSILLIHSAGAPIGPPVAQQHTGFPLDTNLAGTAVTITVQGASSNAFILAAEPHWIRALLPGGTQLGPGILTVTYEDQVSEPYEIRVVERYFRLYDGSWCGPSAFSNPPGFCSPRMVENVSPDGDAIPNTFMAPARPGQLVALRGTGLGFAPGDEQSRPIPDNLTFPALRAFIGTQQAKVVYAGRSGCCAGVDEVVVEVPDGIEGCNVPAWVIFNPDGSATNDAFISISSGDGACSDPQALSQSEVRKLASGNLQAAQVWAIDGTPATWGGYFGAATNTGVIPFGTCRAYSWAGPFAVEVPLASLRDAGPVIILQTPAERSEALRSPDNFYNGALSGPLAAGQYAIDNGSGGPGVGPFRAGFSIAWVRSSWTNRDSFTGLAPGEDVTVEWSGGDPAGQISVTGTFGMDGEISGGFICYERASKGKFTIPWPVVERFRATSPNANEFGLAVASFLVQRIEIPGLDLAELFLPGSSARKIVSLE